MSYPKGLDEYTDHQLEQELRERRAAREAGHCDYCRGTDPAKPCRFPERHAEGARAAPGLWERVFGEKSVVSHTGCMGGVNVRGSVGEIAQYVDRLEKRVAALEAQKRTKECPACHGSGGSVGVACETCKETGRVPA